MAVLCFGASQVMGWTQFNDGITHDVDFEINDDVWVDWEMPGISTTVNWNEGARLANPFKLTTFEDSIMNISGGVVDSGLLINDRTKLNIYSGLVTMLSVFGNSEVNISGGTIGGNDAVVIGSGSFAAYDTSIVNVTGGVVNALHAENSSKVTVSGGKFGQLHAESNNPVDISGGSINQLYASQSVIISGGAIDWIEANWASEVLISGGLISLELRVRNEGLITLHGSNFAVDGTPVNYGELTSILGDGGGGEPHRQLSGTLASGELIDVVFRISGNGRIVLVDTPLSPTPIARAGNDQMIADIDGNGSEVVALDGSNSFDNNGSIVSWDWQDNLGDAISDGETTNANLSLGKHTITLTVTDDQGLTDTDTVAVTVHALLVADAGEDIVADTGEEVTLDASGSYDQDGHIVQYAWTLLTANDGLPSVMDRSYFGPESTFKIKALGRVEDIYILTVTDDDGITAEDTVSIFNRRVEELAQTPGPEGPQGPAGPQGQQGPPGTSPEVIVQMQEQIGTLEQQKVQQQQVIDGNRYLLEQLPQLQKKIKELMATVEEEAQ